jgi:hypothetical protein
MSKSYTTEVANATTKMESRHKIARSIRATGKHSKVIHYLGGVSEETHFENYFSMARNTFVRYERDACETPKHYMEATWIGDDLVEKQSNQIGYFANGNFFDEVWGFINIFEEEKNYFWLDFCGMPTEDLLDSLYYSFFHEDSHMECAEEIYLTFYLNARGVKFVSNLINRYGNSLEDRANSLCDSIRERFSVDNYQFSVFDVYVNGNSPMAVIKISKQ